MALEIERKFLVKNEGYKQMAYNTREEEKAKKVLRNLVIGLIVIAAGFILVSQLV